MTAEVELIGRFIKRKLKTEEDIMVEKAQRLIHGDDKNSYDELNKEYSYEPMVIDMYAVADYMRLDEEHTQVTMKYGVYYIFKINYEDFKMVRQQVTRTVLTQIEGNTDILEAN